MRIVIWALTRSQSESEEMFHTYMTLAEPRKNKMSPYASVIILIEDRRYRKCSSCVQDKKRIMSLPSSGCYPKMNLARRLPSPYLAWSIVGIDGIVLQVGRELMRIRSYVAVLQMVQSDSAGATLTWSPP